VSAATIWRRERDSVCPISLASITYRNSESLNSPDRRESPGGGTKQVQRTHSKHVYPVADNVSRRIKTTELNEGVVGKRLASDQDLSALVAIRSHRAAVLCRSV
jgi:hypothetical protein